MFDELPKSFKKAYEKKGINNDAQLRRMFPRKYKDYTHPVSLKKVNFSLGNPDIAVVATVLSTKESYGKVSMLAVKAVDTEGTPFRANFLNINWAKKLLNGYIGTGKQVLFCGIFQYQEIYGYSCFNPIFCPDVHSGMKVLPVYSSVKGIGESTLPKHIGLAIAQPETDTIPSDISGKYPEINDAFRMIHLPDNADETALGHARMVLDDLVYFKLLLLSEGGCETSHFRLDKRQEMDEMLRALPYSLTMDQENTINAMLSYMASGKRLNALVQGDVGCGKTVIAYALMRNAAENGFQSILMAPTQILAEQHYDGFKQLVDEDEIAFFDGRVKGRKKEELEERIVMGKVHYIIGTSALLHIMLDRQKVALAIIDEEHRFGVGQRDSLVLSDETHIVTMSATPIPRSLAKTVYGDTTQVYQIRQKPAGRKPVITYYDDGKKDKQFLLWVLKQGGQAYVVCPLKEEAESGSRMEAVLSAEEVFTEYSKVFGNLGFSVGLVTGTTKAAQKQAVIEDFKTGKISILVSTTVIEVGVNVPNANLIVIKNAERFGLATLHQLRGRVGRGDRQSYCILVSSQKNERLAAMCRTSDGFEIAEADLAQRNSGDILGTRQSGRNHFIEEIIQYPEIEKDAAQVVEKLNYRYALMHLHKYSKIYQKETS